MKKINSIHDLEEGKYYEDIDDGELVYVRKIYIDKGELEVEIIEDPEGWFGLHYTEQPVLAHTVFDFSRTIEKKGYDSPLWKVLHGNS